MWHCYSCLRSSHVCLFQTITSNLNKSSTALSNSIAGDKFVYAITLSLYTYMYIWMWDKIFASSTYCKCESINLNRIRKIFGPAKHLIIEIAGHCSTQWRTVDYRIRSCSRFKDYGIKTVGIILTM